MGGGVKIPDYSIYKTDGIQELEKLQAALAKRGLKDPWIRNEVWRYHPDRNLGWAVTARKSMFRGLKYAVLLMVPVVWYDRFYKSSSGHGDAHH